MYALVLGVRYLCVHDSFSVVFLHDVSMRGSISQSACKGAASICILDDARKKETGELKMCARVVQFTYNQILFTFARIHTQWSLIQLSMIRNVLDAARWSTWVRSTSSANAAWSSDTDARCTLSGRLANWSSHTHVAQKSKKYFGLPGSRRTSFWANKLTPLAYEDILGTAILTLYTRNS